MKLRHKKLAKMKTYLINIGTSLNFSTVATKAVSKEEAFIKVKNIHPKALKSSVRISAVDLDYCNCETVN